LNELDQLLNAREERDLLKKQLSEQRKCLVSMNLNIPGLPKSNRLYAQFFKVMKNRLEDWLAANRIVIDKTKRKVLHHAAGDYFIVPVESTHLTAAQIKEITEQFEQQEKLGRFVDVDVTDKLGHPVSSGKAKLCFFCNQFPAIECRRLNRHTIEELRHFQQNEIAHFLESLQQTEIARKFSILAQRAILYEITLSPKPGLVHVLGSGVHTDMDYRMFIDSTAVIASYFHELVVKGYFCKAENLIKALPLIRQTGLQMEQEMFAQTKGVNTQKGLIFLMGISLFASGYIFKSNKNFLETEFRDTVTEICKNVQSELSNGLPEYESHGSHCFKKYHVGGIRAEAEAGFPTVFNYALPMLEKENCLNDQSLTLTLLTIMSELNDTNILYRSNLEILQTLQQLCKTAIENFSDEKYNEIIDFCAEKKISPGGAADLLSISIFIHLLKTEFNYDF